MIEREVETKWEEYSQMELNKYAAAMYRKVEARRHARAEVTITG